MYIYNICHMCRACNNASAAMPCHENNYHCSGLQVQSRQEHMEGENDAVQALYEEKVANVVSASMGKMPELVGNGS